MGQAVSLKHLAALARIQPQGSPCGICNGKNGIATGFTLSTPWVSYKYYSLDASYSIIYQRRYVILKTDNIFK
jgi:hypothetical protein